MTYACAFLEDWCDDCGQEVDLDDVRVCDRSMTDEEVSQRVRAEMKRQGYDRRATLKADPEIAERGWENAKRLAIEALTADDPQELTTCSRHVCPGCVTRHGDMDLCRDCNRKRLEQEQYDAEVAARPLGPAPHPRDGLWVVIGGRNKAHLISPPSVRVPSPHYSGIDYRRFPGDGHIYTECRRRIAKSYRAAEGDHPKCKRCPERPRAVPVLGGAP